MLGVAELAGQAAALADFGRGRGRGRSRAGAGAAGLRSWRAGEVEEEGVTAE